ASPDAYEPDNSLSDPAVDNPSTSLLLPLPAIAPGVTQIHSLDIGGTLATADRDFVTLTLATPMDVLIQTDVESGPGNTILRFFDDTGRQLDTGMSPLIETGVAAGTYFLCVEEAGLESGTAQTIDLYRVTALVTAPGTPFAPVVTS